MALTDKLTAIGNAIRAKKGTMDKYTLEGMVTAINSIETGVDTSDATAAAEDIVKDKTAYVNGVKVTGTRKKATQITGDVTSKIILHQRARFSGKTSEAFAIDANKSITLVMPAVDLGDAGDADVAKGKTYTSANGFKRTGTKEEAVAPNFQSKSVTYTANGTATITPDDGYDGLSSVDVTVDVAPEVHAKWDNVTFIDYDGSVLYSYSLIEAQALTELPALPSHDGLVCQGWNYDLATIKSYGRKVNIGATYITDDGTTRIYIKLEDGRTSPMLGVCPNGTVDVDWGDGTAHDILTGTSTSTAKWTPTHNYASAGEYIIKLTVTGSMGFYGLDSSNEYSGILRYSSGADTRNYAYQNAVQRVEIGNSVTSIGNYAFQSCSSLSSIVIPNSVTSIGERAFQGCYSLSSIVIPNRVTSIGNYAFQSCSSLSSIVIPNSVTSIGERAFYSCFSLSSIVIPNSVTSIGNQAFQRCSSLSSIVIPNRVTSIGDYAFQVCSSLSSIVIPNGVTSIGNQAFHGCFSLSSIVIPNSVTNIGGLTFCDCHSMAYYDFTSHTFVPILANANAFKNIPADCQIRVPAALYDEWIAVTNWSTYASKIVGV